MINRAKVRETEEVDKMCGRTRGQIHNTEWVNVHRPIKVTTYHAFLCKCHTGTPKQNKSQTAAWNKNTHKHKCRECEPTPPFSVNGWQSWMQLCNYCAVYFFYPLCLDIHLSSFHALQVCVYSFILGIWEPLNWLWPVYTICTCYNLQVNTFFIPCKNKMTWVNFMSLSDKTKVFCLCLCSLTCLSQKKVFFQKKT